VQPTSIKTLSLSRMGRRRDQRRLETYFAIPIKCSLLLPDFNQLKKFYGPLKNYPASNFTKLLSGVPALLNVFRRKGRAKRPKEKDYKMAVSSVVLICCLLSAQDCISLIFISQKKT
jgi:hypothetical protein